MTAITRTRQVAASPTQVWELLADFGSIAQWASRVTHSEVISTIESGPGLTRRVQAGSFVLLERVVAWEPETVLAYVILGLPERIKHVENRWTITGSKDRSDVQLTSTIDAGGRPPQVAAANVVGRVMAQISDDLLSGLAAHFEGTHP